ncbi:hypothetical protein [Nonomuraea sediminis]|uniref:hypothetical protein n=1 Tax=Nonomuraea sediminis TaxID=2835864 RepID=UPI001BDBFB00|nr:hypothetical protein [Nonomuraea sediminis]
MTVRARIAAAWGWHSRWIDAHPVLAPPASGIALFCVGALASWATGEDPTPWGHLVRSAAIATVLFWLEALCLVGRRPEPAADRQAG